MKKPITKKYYIESVLADSILTTKIEVSKTKFEAALKDTEQQYNEQDAQEGDEFYISRYTRSYEHETTVEKQIEFCWGTCSTYFTTLECKQGYRFTK